MKKYIIILLGILLLTPTIVFADTQVKDLKETIESIGLTFASDHYQETSDQAVVYMFRMSTCEHCHDAITWFNEIAVEHGAKFKLRSFNISDNPDNRRLYESTYEYLNFKSGVPLMIVGNNYFRGFNDNTKKALLEAIDKVYEEKDTYDLFEEMEKAKEKEESNDDDKEDKSKFSISTIVIIIAAIVIIGALITIVVIKKKK